MIKACVICSADFDARGKAKTCDVFCRSVLRQRRTKADNDARRKAEHEGDGIACPKCGSGAHVVLSTRQSKAAVQRRRYCVCEHRFTTAEVVVSTKVAPFRLSASGKLT